MAKGTITVELEIGIENENANVNDAHDKIYKQIMNVLTEYHKCDAWVTTTERSPFEGMDEDSETTHITIDRTENRPTK